VFLGDYKNVQFMNDLFGFSLQTSCALQPAPLPASTFPSAPPQLTPLPAVSYKEGPYYKNVRNTPGTPFVAGPSQLPDEGPVGTLYSTRAQIIACAALFPAMPLFCVALVPFLCIPDYPPSFTPLPFSTAALN
jgi:hypothetical protein